MITTILEKTITASNSAQISVGQAPDNYPAYAVTLYLLGVANSDSIKIQYPDGDDWRDTGWILSATTPVITIYGPLDFRVSKLATTAAMGVGLSTTRGVV
jgi:hypothetical protein